MVLGNTENGHFHFWVASSPVRAQARVHLGCFSGCLLSLLVQSLTHCVWCRCLTWHHSQYNPPSSKPFLPSYFTIIDWSKAGWLQLHWINSTWQLRVSLPPLSLSLALALALVHPPLLLDRPHAMQPNLPYPIWCVRCNAPLPPTLPGLLQQLLIPHSKTDRRRGLRMISPRRRWAGYMMPTHRLCYSLPTLRPRYIT